MSETKDDLYHRVVQPRYEAVRLPGGAWGVLAGRETVAYFSGYAHPDPEGAAKGEAARLENDRP